MSASMPYMASWQKKRLIIIKANTELHLTGIQPGITMGRASILSPFARKTEFDGWVMSWMGK